MDEVGLLPFFTLPFHLPPWDYMARGPSSHGNTPENHALSWIPQLSEPEPSAFSLSISQPVAFCYSNAKKSKQGYNKYLLFMELYFVAIYYA